VLIAVLVLVPVPVLALGLDSGFDSDLVPGPAAATGSVSEIVAPASALGSGSELDSGSIVGAGPVGS